MSLLWGFAQEFARIWWGLVFDWPTGTGLALLPLLPLSMLAFMVMAGVRHALDDWFLQEHEDTAIVAEKVVYPPLPVEIHYIDPPKTEPILTEHTAQQEEEEDEIEREFYLRVKIQRDGMSEPLTTTFDVYGDFFQEVRAGQEIWVIYRVMRLSGKVDVLEVGTYEDEAAFPHQCGLPEDAQEVFDPAGPRISDAEMGRRKKLTGLMNRSHA